MKTRLLIVAIVVVLVSTVAYAVDSTKPANHNTNWIERHGQQAKSNMNECLACHDERSECISCHEDTAPRNHTSTFVNRTHGMEARWNKTNCQACHKQDYCDSCHETAVPLSHSRANFREGRHPELPGSHCGTSCVVTSSNWKSNPAQNCIVCHQTRPQDIPEYGTHP